MLANQLKIDFDEMFSKNNEWIDVLDESTILVTGATGLIGSTIIKSILYYNNTYLKNIKVIALARNENKIAKIFKDYLDDRNFSFIINDVTNKLEFDEKRVDYVIHCATSTSSLEYVKKPVELIDTIVNGTLNLLEFSHINSIKSFVYLSSMEVYGSIFDNDSRITEKDSGYINTMSVRSSYPEGKRLAECLCASYVSEYGLNVKVARLAQVFGAGVSKSDNRVFMQLAKCVIDKTDFVMKSDGSSWGNYCYITDAIKALIMLLTKGESGEAYNIVNEKNSMTIKNMAELVCRELANNEFRIIYDIPKTELECGYAPKTVMKLSSKKMNELGWEANVELVDMYKRMINYLNE